MMMTTQSTSQCGQQGQQYIKHIWLEEQAYHKYQAKCLGVTVVNGFIKEVYFMEAVRPRMNKTILNFNQACA